jgi:hypothetical protein
VEQVDTLLTVAFHHAQIERARLTQPKSGQLLLRILQSQSDLLDRCAGIGKSAYGLGYNACDLRINRE